MADILIKGMEMPKEMECVEILFFYNGHCAFRKHERDEWVEAWAVALPEHGRLGDLDEMISDCDKMAEYCKKNGNMYGYDKWQRFSACIDEAPVIVEATE